MMFQVMLSNSRKDLTNKKYIKNIDDRATEAESPRMSK